MELRSPPMNPEPWKVWDVLNPARYCTVEARTWFVACSIGRRRLHCDKTDAALKSE